MKFMSNWNGKVRCVFLGTNTWKLNKVYRVVNGCLENEHGMGSYRYKDVTELNCVMASQFEEVLDIPQPHKSLLKSGMKVVYRNGSHRYVLLETNRLYDPHTWNFSLPISEYNENLIRSLGTSPYDIMEIYDGEILIAKREEKSAKDTKIEELEKRMRELADEIAELKGE